MIKVSGLLEFVVKYLSSESGVFFGEGAHLTLSMFQSGFFQQICSLEICSKFAFSN